jgi:hypothetical protein
MVTHCAAFLWIWHPSRPLEGETDASEVVDGELQTAEADGLARREANVSRVVAIGNKGEFR